MNLKTSLVNSIMSNLRIESDVFAVGMIEDSIDGIDPNQYKQFFNMLMGDEHSYLKPLDRIAKVAKHFKGTRSDELFSGTRDMAKAFYDKIYYVNASMTTYSQENRARVPNDREFFQNMDYSKLQNKDGEKVFTKKDLYILDEIGGPEWIMNIKYIINSKDAIDKIERIIKSAITAKYMKPKYEAIASNITKLLN